ncbi:hypothetical protein ACGC1H_004550 [Rhizoctonia solani]
MRTSRGIINRLVRSLICRLHILKPVIGYLKHSKGCLVVKDLMRTLGLLAMIHP